MAAGAAPPNARQGVLHLYVLSAFAVAQPLFDLLGRYATFFVAHAAGPRDIALFVLVLCLIPPTVFALLELGVGAVSARARWALHALLVALLLAIIVLPPLHRAVELAPPLAFGAAAIGGALGAFAYMRWAAVRTFVTALSPAIVVFPLLFLGASPVAELVRPARTVDTAARVVARPAPVVLVIFDEFSLLALMDSERHIDAARYPNFAALAHTATWYRNATSVADYTAIAVPAILTGHVPDHTLLPIAREHPHNLFTLLGGTYELRVTEPVTDLCPRELCPRAGAEAGDGSTLRTLLADAGLVYLHMLAPAALRGGLPDIQRQWTFQFNLWNYKRIVGATVMDRPALFARFVAAIQPSPRPTLDFLHILLPHYPYIYFPSGTSYQPPSVLFGRRPFNFFAPGEQLDGAAWDDDQREAARLEHLRYLNQLAFVDQLIGRLLDHLRQAGLFDQTLLVVTADHGVCFRPGQSSRYVNEGNHVDIMSVPLFIKAPQQRNGIVDDRNVETIDILPTIADLLGIVLPWPVDGRSLLDPAAALRAEKVIVSPTSRSNQLDLKRFVFPGSPPADLAGLQNRLALFGSDGLDHSVPAAALRVLLDQPVDAVPRAPAPAPFSIELENPARYAQVNPAAGPLPAFVEGRVQSAQPPPHTVLAIAVNGVVRAVTEVLADQSQSPAFGALVPESAWRPGANTVEVYAVVPAGDRFALAPLARADR